MRVSIHALILCCATALETARPQATALRPHTRRAMLGGLAVAPAIARVARADDDLKALLGAVTAAEDAKVQAKADAERVERELASMSAAERLKYQRKQAAIDNKAAADEAARKFRVVFGDQDAADAKPEDTTRNPPKAM
jgi:hypothetical protein